MKNKFAKILSVCLCAALIPAVAGSAALAAADNSKKNGDGGEYKTVQTASEEKAETVKDETVYVLAAADGSVKKIIVSDWIKNTQGSAVLTDRSELDGIVNVKGDEGYTLGGDKTAVWDAAGSDIYYQGNIDKELPVTVKVTYKLDGRTVTPDELKGKSGKVTIRFDYTNRQYETVEINGVREKIYVPFAMLTGLLLDNDVFTNVEVTNGKIINDGTRTVVAGIAFPGLQQDFNVSRDKLEIPDYVEITADAKNFSLGMTVTVATNELFNALDTDKLDSLDGLTGRLDELTDAVDRLLDGSSRLYDGLCTLLDKSAELAGGVEKLADGAKELKDGAAALDNGASQLQSGAEALSEGLDTVVSNNDTLNNGAKQVFDTLLSTARTQLLAAGLDVPEMTVSNYAEVLSSIIASLDENKVYNTALDTVTAAVEARREYIASQVTSAVRSEVENGVVSAVLSNVTSQVTEAVRSEVISKVTAAVRGSVAEKVIYAATGMDSDSYYAAVDAGLIAESVQAAVNAAVDAQMQSDEVKATVSDNVDIQMRSDEVKALITSSVDAQMQSDNVKAIIDANVSEQMAKNEIKALIAENTETQVQQAISEAMSGDEVRSKLAAASEGAKQVASLKASLDSYNAFYLGLRAYTSGVSEAANGAAALSFGASDLKNGAARLSAGANELYDGILTLKNGVPALADGVTQLRDGSMKLSDGLKEFNDKGVQKLVDAVNGDLGGLIERIKAVSDVSKNYGNFSGLDGGMSGKVKFIYRTDGIE